jgi:hypothetical protein
VYAWLGKWTPFSPSCPIARGRFAREGNQGTHRPQSAVCVCTGAGTESSGCARPPRRCVNAHGPRRLASSLALIEVAPVLSASWRGAHCPRRSNVLTRIARLSLLQVVRVSTVRPTGFANSLPLALAWQPVAWGRNCPQTSGFSLYPNNASPEAASRQQHTAAQGRIWRKSGSRWFGGTQTRALVWRSTKARRAGAGSFHSPT